MAWGLIRPEEFVSPRLPSVAGVRGAAILLAIAVAAGIIPWIVRHRAETTPSRRAVASDGAHFTLIARNGYETSEVDSLVQRLTSLGSAPTARREVAERIRLTRFHLASGFVYEPIEVDKYLDE